MSTASTVIPFKLQSEHNNHQTESNLPECESMIGDESDVRGLLVADKAIAVWPQIARRVASAIKILFVLDVSILRFALGRADDTVRSTTTNGLDIVLEPSCVLIM